MFDWACSYHSQRMPLMARNVVATSQPLAAQAGLRMLQAGGNAVDAAVAAAITLTVVEPTGNGLGSDAFAIIWDAGKLHGINGSGRSPKSWTCEKFAHLTTMPLHGWDAVTVPGAVGVWVALSRRFGRLPFAELFEPTIGYATHGFPVTPNIAAAWKLAEDRYCNFPEFCRVFLPHGRAPRTGELYANADQAATLKEIAVSHGESFYRGELAARIVRCATEQGGTMSLDDLVSHEAEWVEPLDVEYRGIHLHELPPNAQGLAALIALGILGRFDLSRYPVDSADSIHLQVEAMKQGFAVAKEHLADPQFMSVDCRSFLEDAYLSSQAKLIMPHRARQPDASIPHEKGTVYLATADAEGMMVSFIQSNFWGFGSGVVIPGTGIAMQNRAYGFSLKKGHPNQVDGGKRPYHTIIPGFVSRDGKPSLSFGVMGGNMQPQGHLQMVTRMYDYGQNPQTAADAPRWCFTEDGRLAVEPGFSSEVLTDLQRRGHQLVTGLAESTFGGAQLICKTSECYIAGSDPRKDGLAVGF